MDNRPAIPNRSLCMKTGVQPLLRLYCRIMNFIASRTLPDMEEHGRMVYERFSHER